jgi:phage gp46-like protein
MINLPLQLYINGVATQVDDVCDRLMRSVIISLFTWRRANPEDVLPTNQKFGWWGDTFPVSSVDRIGSRLWLLSREKLMPDIPAKAQEYAEEALQWLLDDGVAGAISVLCEIQGTDRLAMQIVIVRGSATINLRFDNLWN